LAVEKVNAVEPTTHPAAQKMSSAALYLFNSIGVLLPNLLKQSLRNVVQMCGG
jgi:hypothetical protein